MLDSETSSIPTLGKAAVLHRSFLPLAFSPRGLWRVFSTLFVYLTFLLLIGLLLLLVLMQAAFPKVFDTVASSFTFSLAPIGAIFVSPRSYFAILHSVDLASLVGVLGTILGGAFAVVIERCAIPFRRTVATNPWILFLTPAYLKTVAWVLLMSSGVYLAEFGILPPMTGSLFFAFPGLTLVHVLGLFPFASFIIGSALRGLGEDAARVGGGPLWRVWLRINLTHLVPALALIFIAIFAQVLSDFGLASTIARMSNFGVLTYEIYAATSSYPINFPLAGTQSLVLLVLMMAVVVIDRLLRGRGEVKLFSGHTRQWRDYRLGSWGWLVTLVVFL